MKTFLQTLLFFLVLVQIIFAQWQQSDFRNRTLKSPKIMLPMEQSEQQLHFRDQLLNNKLKRSSIDTITESWVRHYSGGLIPANDDACAIVVDKSSNIYVTGSSTAPFGSDFYTLKYDPFGSVIWGVRYDGGGHDIAQDITIDDSCNVYVTGWSTDAGSFNPDFITIKYSALGNEEWIARYSGPENKYDYTSDISVDTNGSVYVTGWSEIPDPYNSDYVTVKYNVAGIEEWLAIYDGPGNSWDKASGIAVDLTGNVYVTGSSWAAGSSLDYATIKYSPLGIKEWVVRYEGSANYYDIPADIALDGAGNIYVTGQSSGSGTHSDYATIKYSPAGNEEWVALYNCCNDDDIATAIAVDHIGNVYVTGWSTSPSFSSDYATIKYDSSGNQLWVSRYSGPENDTYACDIAVDSFGNVYVTGWSEGSNPSGYYDYATIKYNESGNEQWVARYDGPRNLSDLARSIAVDAIGNVYITGTSMGSTKDWDYEYATVKYNPFGNEEWVDRYNGPGTNQAGAKDITVDMQGNIYVTGSTMGSENNWDYATVKYNSSGYEEWAVHYRGPDNYDDEATALTVDIYGNVYVTGGSPMGWYDGDITTIKYNFNGSEEWLESYNGPGNAGDAATDIIMDKLGNIYVTGWSTGSIDGLDYITIKYSSSGIQQWVARYDGPGYGIDYANGIAVDTSGSVYVTGVSDGDYTTIKYSSAGTEEWIARYDFTGEFDQATAISNDATGNICVTGWSIYNAGNNSDYITIKYNQFGTEQWVAHYSGPDSTYSGATDITVDAYGNFYVTGVSAGDYATIKYNPMGIEEWVARYDGPVNEVYTGDIKLDILGNVYITGTSYGSNTSADYVTIKYEQSGTEDWVALYNGPGLEDKASAIAIDTLGNVYVTGSSGYEYFWSTFTTIKYEQFPNSVDEDGTKIPSAFALVQNYPNPFNHNTVIGYQLLVSGNVTLKVYDVLGNEVSTLVNGEKPAGSYEAEFNGEGLPSGVYFYKLQAGNLAEVKKMILIK